MVGPPCSDMGIVTYITPDGESFTVAATPGISIMQLATSNAIAGIDAECGGSLSCATCHVYVDLAWTEGVGQPGKTENVMLQFTHEQRSNSRLSCQIRYQENLDGLVLHIPEQQ